jgi:hypothetical protein
MNNINQINLICMAVIAFATIYIIYQNIQVISSFNKITTNINRLNDGINSQVTYLSKLNSQQNTKETPILPTEPKQNNSSNLRQQYNTYEPNSFLETDSNISAGEDNQEPEVSGADQTNMEILSPELKSQIDNLEDYNSDNEDDEHSNSEEQLNNSELNEDISLDDAKTELVDENGDLSLDESGMNISESDLNLAGSDLNLGESNLNLAESDFNLDESDLNLEDINSDKLDQTNNDESLYLKKYTKEELEELTKIELKEIARHNDLKVTGTKNEIIDRVFNKLNDN